MLEIYKENLVRESNWYKRWEHFIELLLTTHIANRLQIKVHVGDDQKHDDTSFFVERIIPIRTYRKESSII